MKLGKLSSRAGGAWQRAGLLARRDVPLPTAMAPAPTENAFTAAVKAAGGTVKSGEEYVGRRCFRVMYAGANEGCAPLGKGGARRALVLCVDADGFSTHDDTDGELNLVKSFQYPQVHSWAHAPRRFSFRYFDRASRAVASYTFDLASAEDVKAIMAELHKYIEAILQKRKDKAMPVEEFDKLKETLRSNEETQLDELQAVFQTSYVTCAQAKELLALLHDPWDLANAAVMIYQRCIDATRFREVLAFVLDDADDRDNIWHRIKQLPKKTSRVGIQRDSGD